MQSLQAVLFDIDDTLFSTTQFAKMARGNAVRAMIEYGLQATEEQALAELQEVIYEFSSNYDQHFDKLLMRLSGRSLHPARRSMIVSAGVVAYHDTKFQGLELFEDVKPLLVSLKSCGIRIGVITHGWTAKQTEKLIRLGLVPVLITPDSVFISDSVGINKPNPKLYQVALDGMGLEDPSQVMYVGDNPKNDIAPPMGLGMKTVWCTRASKTKSSEIIPTHKVSDFSQLAEILRTEYHIPLPPV